jgi:hypothetical protein
MNPCLATTLNMSKDDSSKRSWERFGNFGNFHCLQRHAPLPYINMNQATKSEISEYHSSQNYSVPKCDFAVIHGAKLEWRCSIGNVKYDFLILVGSADKFKAKYIPFVIRCQ